MATDRLRIFEDGDNELIYIYHILRRLGKSKNDLIIKSFPKRYMLKLINGRLAKLETLADSLVTKLFKRLTKKQKVSDTTNLEQQSTIVNYNNRLFATKCVELDEYFHLSLYYLHDFVIELDWHKPDIEDISREDFNYVKLRLKHIESFLQFREILISNLFSLKTTSPKSIKSPSLSPRLKSNLSLRSNGRVESPTRKRRIRFKDSPSSNDNSTIRPDVIKDGHSILALDLLIFSLNIFVQVMFDKLIDWSISSDISKSMSLLIESKGKIRSNQLNSIAKQIKASNDIHLAILELLLNLRQIYLSDLVINILCGSNSERILSLYKKPHVKAFVTKISEDVERRILMQLSKQCLQILFDLIILEINLPPIELDSYSRRNSRVELKKSRENYFNFISSWLNIDQTVFGLANSKKDNIPSSNVNSKQTSGPKESTLAAGSGPFKSSSGILAQMDNLILLTNQMLASITARLHSRQQLKFFSNLLFTGFNKFFDQLSSELQAQKDSIRKESNDSKRSSLDLGTNIDLLASDIRILKLVHIKTCIEKIISDIEPQSIV